MSKQIWQEITCDRCGALHREEYGENSYLPPLWKNIIAIYRRPGEDKTVRQHDKVVCPSCGDIVCNVLTDYQYIKR